MSCNGCRVLRKGCSDTCILRPCLEWIETAESQGHATIFLAKFFGRAGLFSFISAVPENQRPALFKSLLFEAAGRTVNPVNGVVGLLSSGKWHVCQAAVATVVRGGSLKPIRIQISEDPDSDKVMQISDLDLMLSPSRKNRSFENRRVGSPLSEESTITTRGGNVQPNDIKLLNLFN